MLKNSITKLDELAAPDHYVIPPTIEDLTYIKQFRAVCARYQIDFSKADADERDFVIRMTEKRCEQKHA